MLVLPSLISFSASLWLGPLACDGSVLSLFLVSRKALSIPAARARVSGGSSETPVMRLRTVPSFPNLLTIFILNGG